jgi:TPR repeat protein
MNALQGGNDTRRELEAVDYFRRSAELGFAPSQVVLGYFYDTGQLVVQEPGQALYWYKKAAEQDDVLGEWLTGELVFSGRAAPVDLTEASAWLKKSAAHGNPFAAYLSGRAHGCTGWEREFDAMPSPPPPSLQDLCRKNMK